MRIVVTGGAGFIGSHYVRSLSAAAPTRRSRAPHVVVLDLLTYAGTRTNLAGLRRASSSTATSATPTRSPGCWPAPTWWSTSRPSRTSTARSRARPTSSPPTSSAPRCCWPGALAAGVDRFVHVSTDEVYGSIDEGAWPETHPLQPNSPYSASKAGSDLLARAYHRTHGLPVCITRCSNNYGPHQFPEKVIPLFVTNLLDGRKVPLYGDGLNVRDWLHVDDHCRGIQLVAEKGRDGEVYNIGGGTELTNRDLTHRLLAAVGAGPEMIEPVRRPPGPRPPLLRGLDQDRRRAGLRAPGALRPRASPPRWRGTATTATGGSP